MRVTCPNCNAVYDVPGEELGVGGRRVECAACNEQWFQPGPPPEAGEGGGRMPGMADASAELASLTRPELDLEEASRGYQDPPEQDPAPSEPAFADTPAPGDLPPNAPRRLANRPRDGQRPAAGPDGRRRPASIDAERLSAELRAAEDAEERTSSGLGYATGFVLALIISGALAFCYIERETITVLAPEAAPYVERFAQGVDQFRRNIETIAEAVRSQLDG